MLLLTQGNTSDTLVVTLAEKTTINGANYLFVFENVATRQLVKTVLLHASDASIFQSRYNKWTVNTSSLFGANTGQYLYSVYEQASTSNTDPTGLNLVESGKMEVLKSSAKTITGFSPTTTYSGYGG